MSNDVVLTVDSSSGFYDISIDEIGDIKTADFFDTAILYSLFGERRAAPDEIVDANNRRGWIGNSDNFENGSKLWLFSQSRLTRSVINRIEDEAKKSLQWLVEDGYAVSIQDPVSEIIQERLILTVTILRSRDKITRRSYDIWENTGRPA